MRIAIDGKRRTTNRPSHIMLVDEPMLNRCVKRVALLDSPDLPEEPGRRVDVRKFVYNIDFLHPAAMPSAKRAKLEALLLQPFFNFWWSGFDRFSVNNTTDQNLATTLKASVNTDKWPSPIVWISVLAQAREVGLIAFRAGNFATAHEIWQNAHDLKQMTVHTNQGYHFVTNRDGKVWGSRVEENCFHIHSNLAAVLLRLADATEDQEKRRDLLNDAHQQCIFGIDFSHMGNFVPTNAQLSKVHLRYAQAMRMREDADMRQLIAARRAVEEAHRLNPGEAKIMEETALVMCLLKAHA